MHKFIQKLPAVFFIGTCISHAQTISRNLELKFINEEDSSSVKIVSGFESKSGETLKVASFNDLKGNVFTISNKAVFNQAQRAYVNLISIHKKEHNSSSLKVVASLSLLCVANEGLPCRAKVESENISVEVESVSVEAPAYEEASILELILGSFKALDNGEELVKTLEDLSISTYLKANSENLIYSDSQSRSSLNIISVVDVNNNVDLKFVGKDGSVSLLTRSAQRTTFEIYAPSPVGGLKFRRALNVETIMGIPNTPAVLLERAGVKAKIEQMVDDEYRGLLFDPTLLLDETSLRPDPTQSGYSVGKGVLVLKEQIDLGNRPSNLETYWDLEPVEAADPLKNLLRTQVYKIEAGESNRVIKIRSISGQRARLTLADTPDPSKKDISTLEL